MSSRWNVCDRPMMLWAILYSSSRRSFFALQFVVIVSGSCDAQKALGSLHSTSALQRVWRVWLSAVRNAAMRPDAGVDLLRRYYQQRGRREQYDGVTSSVVGASNRAASGCTSSSEAGFSYEEGRTGWRAQRGCRSSWRETNTTAGYIRIYTAAVIHSTC
jgi:hypothetical protein